MKQTRKTGLGFIGMGISLALDLLGIALGFLFVVSVFVQAQFVMLLLSALILALAWIQSQIKAKLTVS